MENNHNSAASLKDRRVRRSQHLLREALLALILEKPYQDITVQDIIDRANVGRSTFYAHFLDKDHLLKSGFDDLRKLLERNHLEIDHEKMEFGTALYMLHHVKDYHSIYKALMGKRGADWIVQEVQDVLTLMVRSYLSGHGKDRPDNDIPFEVQVQFKASALMGLLKWWLDNDMPYSAEQMHQWFHQLAGIPLVREW